MRIGGPNGTSRGKKPFSSFEPVTPGFKPPDSMFQASASRCSGPSMLKQDSIHAEPWARTLNFGISKK